MCKKMCVVLSVVLFIVLMGAEGVTATTPKKTAPTRKAKTATPATPTPAVSLVPAKDLISDLGDDDGRIAKEAAKRLIRRKDAVQPLVEAFGSKDTNTTTKKRVLWCLKNMGETARSWLINVLDNPDSYRPRLVFMVEEVFDALGGDFTPPAAPKSAKTADDGDETTNAAPEKVAECERLIAELKDKTKALAKDKIELQWAARTANLTHKYKWCNYARCMKAKVEKEEEEITKLEEQIKQAKDEIPDPPP